MFFSMTGLPVARWLTIAGLMLGISTPFCAPASTLLRMQTDLGGVDIELFDSQAPLTVENFLNYVDSGDYDGTFIHRSVPGFVVQGGGYIFNPANGDFFGGGTSQIATYGTVKNEADPVNRPNLRGTLAMAKKASDPDSATSQWFVNLVDNPGLDDPSNAGGFTVFGQVLGNGMAVWDEVAALSVCKQIPRFASDCYISQYPVQDMPAVDWNQAVSNNTLINIVHIGTDTDGDGVIDALEHAAPNNGDANNDKIQDSTQAGVASFPDSTGNYVVIQSSTGVTIHDLDILGATFGLANPPTVPGQLDGLGFSRGYVGYELDGVSPGGATSVTETFSGGPAAYTYYNFGPTPDNATPHWYEFLYDGTTGTGAKINGNTVVVYFKDGARGDGDLDDANGVIKASPGGAAINLQADADGDGVPDAIENAAPHAGDANNDGMLDSLQGDVASLQDINGAYVTLQTDALLRLAGVSIANVPPAGFSGISFSGGYLSFGVSGAAAGAQVKVTLTLPSGSTPNTYYIYGPTPQNPNPHWYDFSFDGKTGALIAGNVITLNFLDGKRGDGDLDNSNGAIVMSPGGAASCEDADSDCIPDSVEDAAPNGGDGNGDKVPDSAQGNIVSFPNTINGQYVTLVTTPPLVFQSAGDQSSLLFTTPSKAIQALNFTNGLFGFSVTRPNTNDAGAVTVEVILPEGTKPTTYYQYGPTPDDPMPHWYEFLYDKETGAEIDGNHVTLHFVDGKRGDADLTVNGTVADPGAPAQKAKISGGGGGGGCSAIAGTGYRTPDGAWWILVALMLALRSRSSHPTRVHSRSGRKSWKSGFIFRRPRH
jgi:cyclophilin family peptidyl-prolyl cis-trans isomerase